MTEIQLSQNIARLFQKLLVQGNCLAMKADLSMFDL